MQLIKSGTSNTCFIEIISGFIIVRVVLGVQDETTRATHPQLSGVRGSSK
jgi:hypothetical protein